MSALRFMPSLIATRFGGDAGFLLSGAIVGVTFVLK
jgi:hypothetical protein